MGLLTKKVTKPCGCYARVSRIPYDYGWAEIHRCEQHRIQRLVEYELAKQRLVEATYKKRELNKKLMGDE